MKRLRFLLALAALLGMSLAAAADEGVDTFALRLLSDLQRDALERRVESCGYIYRQAGALRARIQRGNREFCDSTPDSIPEEAELVASFHNHGAFTEDFDSEVPSADDLDADREDELNGYVATPGGRVWKIRWRESVAEQLCVGCVARDPRHRDGVFLPIRPRYTRAELVERAREDERGAR